MHIMFLLPLLLSMLDLFMLSSVLYSYYVAIYYLLHLPGLWASLAQLQERQPG